MEQQERTPYDERAALAELERFRLDIEKARAKRKAVSDEFEEFIRSFKTEAEHDATPKPKREPVTAFVTLPYETIAPFVRPAPQPPPVRRSWTGPVVALAIVGILSAAGFAAWTQRTTTPSSVPAVDVPAAPVAESPAPAPVSSPTPPPAVPAESGSVLTTSRPAWVRIIADGERVLERELPAGATVPIPAARTIVVRTGDAGAVRVSIAGVDQGALGRAGEVVTRTFTLSR